MATCYIRHSKIPVEEDLTHEFKAHRGKYLCLYLTILTGWKVLKIPVVDVFEVSRAPSFAASGYEGQFWCIFHKKCWKFQTLSRHCFGIEFLRFLMSEEFLECFSFFTFKQVSSCKSWKEFCLCYQYDNNLINYMISYIWWKGNAAMCSSFLVRKEFEIFGLNHFHQG